MKMSNDEIPVLLVVKGKAINGLNRVVKHLSELCQFKIFYVVCPERDVAWAGHVLNGLNADVHILFENKINDDLTTQTVRASLARLGGCFQVDKTTGWYYQQFLKMEFSRYISGFENYLIWDADTLLLKRIDFFEEKKIMITTGREFHRPYFRTIENLLNGESVSAISHISQHLMVNTKHMLDLLRVLEKPSMKWWEGVIDSFNDRDLQQFSEYETYSSYCLSRFPMLYKSVDRDWFRYGRSLTGSPLETADVLRLQGLYDFVAFEDWDDGWIKNFRANFLFCQSWLGRKIRRKS
jgi:hypothetical protein